MQCVYCEVRTIWKNVPDSHRGGVASVLVKPCAICDDRVAQGQVFDRPCQHHSTNVPFSSSSTCWSYEKDKQAKTGKQNKAMMFQKTGSVGLQGTFLHVCKGGGVYHGWGGWLPVSSLGQSTWNFYWTEQHWDRFLSIFLVFHLSLVTPLLHTLPPLFAAPPTNKTDAHWETGELEIKKKITFLALKNIYVFGNRNDCV